MKRIAIANLKGGVAKSTTTMMLSESLALFHRARVLVIDFDPQCNCSMMFLSRMGAELEEAHGRTLYHFLSNLTARPAPNFASFVCPNATDLEPLRNRGHVGRVDLIPCSLKMWFAQSAFEREAYKNKREPDELLAEGVQRLLATIEPSYDFVLFDCPPGFPTLSRAALRVSDAVLSPTIADQVSVRSLRDFHEIAVSHLGLAQRSLFVLVTKFVAGNNVHKFFLDRLRRDYHVIGSPIKFSVDIVRATERSSAQSKRTLVEKYRLQGNALKALGRAFMEAVRRGSTRDERTQTDQPRRSA